MLYIVGQGSLKNQLQSLINKYRLEDNIALAGGNKPSKEIPLWMNACDLFVLPSLSEGNPTVMFECLGCGKSFVGTNVGGIPEVITNKKLGILVEPKDVSGLANAILKALDKEWDKNYISKYAEQFTWDKIAEKIMEVYDEVAEKD
jgi:glycosyltransferase involved in cell wall biosynthesis